MTNASTVSLMREKLFTMRMSADEHALLEKVAELRHKSSAELVRVLVREENERLSVAARKEEENERRHWLRDLSDLVALAAVSGVEGLTVKGTWETREFRIGTKRHQVAVEHVSLAVTTIADWPGSKIIGWTHEGDAVVAGRRSGTGYVVRKGATEPDRSTVYIEDEHGFFVH